MIMVRSSIMFFYLLVEHHVSQGFHIICTQTCGSRLQIIDGRPVTSPLFLSDETETLMNEGWESTGSFSATEDGYGGENHESEEETMIIDEYQRWMHQLTLAIQSLDKKIRSLENELEKVEQLEQTVARANLLKTYLYMFAPGVKSVVVQDWENDGEEVELTLDPAFESASVEVDALFQQARKLKRGSEIVSSLLEAASEGRDILLEAQKDMVSVLAEDDQNAINVDLFRMLQDRLCRTSRTTNFHVPPENHPPEPSRNTPTTVSKPKVGSPASNIRKLKSPAGCTILVGRNRRGNEYLSTQIARGQDIWMHARGSPGAHILILQRRGDTQATEDCWQFAANLAAFYSDNRSERRTDITAAEPKHVLKPRNAPLGAVKLREEWKVLAGFPEQVPEELKEARGASGQIEGYRSVDKSKLRRRNKQTLEKDKAKRKGRRAK